jgi:hypothetical protein
MRLNEFSKNVSPFEERLRRRHSQWDNRLASQGFGAEIGQKTTSMSVISECLFLLDAVVKRRFDGLMILERISGKVA